MGVQSIIGVTLKRAAFEIRGLAMFSSVIIDDPVRSQYSSNTAPVQSKMIVRCTGFAPDLHRIERKSK